MRKGLTLTLMTVAIAMISVQAYALAPVISDIPSPVVGGNPNATNPNMFVYTDAFDLNNLASDDALPSSQLLWSYEIVGTPKYLINGVPPINSSSTDPTSPTMSKLINRTVGKVGAVSELNPDGKANTITVRNTNLWPIGNTTTTLPSLTGLYDQQAVTFYCSDGLAYSAQTVFFYTDYGGSNRLSVRPTPVWTPVKDDKFLAGATKWKVFENGGTVDPAPWSDGNGMCFTVPGPGENVQSLVSPMGYFSLTANTIYKIRARMNGSQSAPGHTPFWDFIIENYDYVSQGLNLYGFDSFFFDNEGGANAVVNDPTNSTWYTMYWTPAAVKTTQWNDPVKGLFSPTFSAMKDPRLRFRIMDFASDGPTQGANKSGQICMQELVIESMPVSKIKVLQPVANLTKLVKTDAMVPTNPDIPGANVQVIYYGGCTVSLVPVNGGAQQYIKLTPSGVGTTNDGTKKMIAEMSPASTNKMVWGDWTTFADKYPYAWKTGRVYKLEAMMSAPDALSVAHPFDVMWMTMESPTNECNAETFVSANKAIGTPTLVAQPYMMLYYSGKETKSTVNELHFLRWRIRFGNDTTLNWPTPGDMNNAGGVQVQSVQLDQIDFMP